MVRVVTYGFFTGVGLYSITARASLPSPSTQVTALGVGPTLPVEFDVTLPGLRSVETYVSRWDSVEADTTLPGLESEHTYVSRWDAVEADATLPEVSSSEALELFFDPRVARPLTLRRGQDILGGLPVSTWHQEFLEAGAKLRAQWRYSFLNGVPLQACMWGVELTEGLRFQRSVSLALRNGLPLCSRTLLAHADSLHLSMPGTLVPLAGGLLVRSLATQHYQTMERLKRSVQLPIGQGHGVRVGPYLPLRQKAGLGRSWKHLLLNGIPPRPGWSLYTVLLPGEHRPTYEPLPPRIIIPVLRLYMITNSIRVYTSPDLVEVEVTDFKIDIDQDSWAWGFSFSTSSDYLSLLVGEGEIHRNLEARVNNSPFLLVVENVSRSREFGSDKLSVSGRGHSAYLDKPFSGSQNFFSNSIRTANQLMLDALTINGVSIGWEVDWGIEDWLVPARVWSLQGTFIKAITAIAGSVGANVYPDPYVKTLHIKPDYAAMPWHWGAMQADIEIPADVAKSDRFKWVDKPPYTGVYVAGVSQGVLGFVKRSGTDGSVTAPTVTDDLITTVGAARMRGSSILARSGKMLYVTLTMPLMEEMGIILPGSLVRYVDGSTVHLGVSQSVSIRSASLADTTQTIEIETHR